MTTSRAPFLIEWKPDATKPGNPLSNLPVKEGKWQYSETFRDITIAHEWGYKDPFEFWALPRETRALLIAYSEARGQMTAYEDQIATHKSSIPDPQLKRKL